MAFLNTFTVLFDIQVSFNVLNNSLKLNNSKKIFHQKFFSLLILFVHYKQMSNSWLRRLWPFDRQIFITQKVSLFPSVSRITNNPCPTSSFNPAIFSPFSFSWIFLFEFISTLSFWLVDAQADNF